MKGSYFETNLMGMTILLLIFFHTKYTGRKTKSSHIFNKITLLISAAMASDILYAIVDGKTFFGARVLNCFALNVYFVASIFAAYFMFEYTACEIELAAKNRKLKYLILIPAIILTVLTVTSPFTHLIYYMNESNVYTRGPLYFIQPPLTCIYMIASSVIAYSRSKHSVLPEAKRHCIHLCIYTLLPVAGGMTQALFFGFNLTMPSIVIAATMLCLDDIEIFASLDSLTKLSNRRQFDAFIAGKMSSSGVSDFTLIFLDINNFKMINDTFGHIVGDKALIEVSRILCETFSDTQAFIARYGGDEFAITTHTNIRDTERLISEIRSKLRGVSQELPFTLSVSVGYAVNTGTYSSADAIIKAADELMYEDKRYSKTHR